MKPALSIIIPTLNEAIGIQELLLSLAPLRKKGCEIIVIDGGSRDRTKEIASPHADSVINAPKGRAFQMTTGAEKANSDILLFLHADTFLPDDAINLILKGIDKGHHWGRFDIQLTGNHSILKLIALMMNWRSRLTGIATGDQGIFVTKKAFEEVGRFPEIALMEDIAISKKLKLLGKPYCITEKVTSSWRRWEKHGVFRTMVLMWILRLMYFLGANPEKLALIYSRGFVWKR